jgi:peptide deformylase
MAVDPPNRIIHYPDPRLRKMSVPVTKFDGNLATLVSRIVELMRTGNGVGLAAPQTGVNLRIFACNPSGEPDGALVFINPELIDMAGKLEAEEGCLSLPDIRVVVHRARRCRIRAQDVTGKTFELEAENLLARIWQHEIDHLDGKLIIDRMDATDRIANRKRIADLEADFDRAAKRSKGRKLEKTRE